MEDIFRFMFGFPNSGRPKFSDPGEDDFKPYTYRFSFGFPPERSEEDPSGTEMFHPGLGREIDDMQRHFHDMFRSFDSVFKSMGMVEFPPPAIQPPGLEALPGPHHHHHHDDRSPRDFLLKRPNEPIPQPAPPASEHQPHTQPHIVHPEQPQQPPASTQPPYKPSLFSRLWGYKPNVGSPSHSTGDTDLDANMDVEGIEKIIRENLTPETSPYMKRKQLAPHGSDTDSDIEQEEARQRHGGVFKRVTVHTYRNINGQVEQRRTIQDGSGREESTVQRSMGDQTYSITTKKHPGKPAETLEDFINMDEGDKKAFNEKWASPGMPSVKHGDGSPQPPATLDVIDKETESIFRNLFRRGFPGFVKRD